MSKSWGKRVLSAAASAVLALSPLSGSSTGLWQFSAQAVEGADGLPVYTDYRDSVFYKGNPLGVPGDFHLFGFKSISTNDHVNGNFATPEFHMGGQPGLNNDVGRTLTVISEKMVLKGQVYSYDEEDPSKSKFVDGADTVNTWSLNRSTDVYFPADYELFGTNDWSVWEKPLSEMPAKDEAVRLFLGDHTQESVPYVTLGTNTDVKGYAHASKTFIDFEAEREKAFALSQTYREMDSTITLDWTDVDGPIGEPDGHPDNLEYNLAKEGTNVINISVNDP